MVCSNLGGLEPMQNYPLGNSGGMMVPRNKLFIVPRRGSHFTLQLYEVTRGLMKGI